MMKTEEPIYLRVTTNYCQENLNFNHIINHCNE